MTAIPPPPAPVAPGSGPAMPDHVFRTLADIARREAGLTIPDSKRTLVQSRIARRLRALALTDFAAYATLVSGDGTDAAAERRQMVSVLTTNVTSFFREAHHFDLLATEVVAPRLAAGDRIRIWSAGCSTGQEPYSIAMTILNRVPDAANRDVRVLATDIDPAVLDRARAGIYPAGQDTGLGPEDRRRHFVDEGGAWRVSDPLAAMVTIRELNLLRPWPMKGRFHAIFCRNVVIYFDDATQRRLWPRFVDRLEPGGWLFLGHSERVHDEDALGLERAGVTAWRKR